jgi:hypothetical protein
MRRASWRRCSSAGSRVSTPRYRRTGPGELVGHPLLPAPVQRAVTTAVAKQYGRGVVGTVRVETTRNVARHALRALEDLEAEEAAAASRDPMNGGRRQRRIVERLVELRGLEPPTNSMRRVGVGRPAARRHAFAAALAVADIGTPWFRRPRPNRKFYFRHILLRPGNVVSTSTDISCFVG